MHAEADPHDTPARKARSGLGVVWMAQAVPFHRSASVTATPLLLLAAPTPVQAEDDVHDTALNVPAGAEARTASGRAGEEAAATAGVSITPAPRPTAARAAAYLLAWHLRTKRVKLITSYKPPKLIHPWLKGVGARPSSHTTRRRNLVVVQGRSDGYHRLCGRSVTGGRSSAG